MGVVIPVGDMQASFVFEQANSAKQVTWTLGVKENPLVSPLETAQGLYASFTGGETPAGTTPYEATQMSVAWTFVGVSVAEQTADGPLVYQVFDPIVGTDSSHPIPINCAYLAVKSTASGGRKNRGRAYLPPLNIGEVYVNGGGQIEAPYLAEIQSLYDAAFVFVDGFGIVPCVHHSDGSAGTVITSFDVGATIATQRRRLR